VANLTGKRCTKPTHTKLPQSDTDSKSAIGKEGASGKGLRVVFEEAEAEGGGV
jgi:hypothetical protein